MSEPNQFCTFYVGGLYFGVDVLNVQEVLNEQDMTPVPLASDEVSGLINLRGQIVTAIDLRRRLAIGQSGLEAPPMNVVVNTDDEIFSLLVDEIGDVIEPKEGSFENPPETLSDEAKKLVTGVYKLDGKLLLILDTKAAVALEGSGGLTPVEPITPISKKTMEEQTIPNQSLFNRLGGAPAIDAAVDQFYERVLADTTLAPFFKGVSMPRQIKQQKAFFTTALGGPTVYKGKDMKEAHAHLAIEDKHFGMVAGHLVATLQALNVPQAIIDEVVAAISPLAADIVNTPST